MSFRGLKIVMSVIVAAAIAAIAQGNIDGGLGKPLFKNQLAFSPSRESGKTDVDILLSIPLSGLQFVKHRPVYRARFDVLIALYDGDALVSKLYRRDSIEVDSYSETNSARSVSPEPYSLESIEPREYRLSISIVDRESKETSSKSAQIVVPMFAVDSLPVFGSLILLEGDPLRPYIQDSYPLGDSIHFTTTIAVPKGLRPIVAFGIEGDDGLLFSDTIGAVDTTADLRLAAPIPPKPSSFRLFVVAEVEGRTLAKIEKRIALASGRYSHFASDKEELVEQLALIEDGSELRPIEKALRDEPERVDSLVELFWAKKDPTPNTELNELREEFYRRIAIANERFRGIKKGWRTDMGKVYILHGEPDDIDRHPFDMEHAAYEIWYYFDPRMTFFFEDRHGTGDYQLVGQE